LSITKEWMKQKGLAEAGLDVTAGGEDFNIPVGQDLERKTVETLLGLAERLEAGTIELDAAQAALEAIYGCVSGIVPPEVDDIIKQLQDEITGSAE